MPEDRTMIPTKVEVLPPSEIVKVQAAVDLDVQIVTAKNYPRSIAGFKTKAYELATVDQETAEECWYSLPRGGKVIEGPSIRFAEIVASSYGNLRAETREIGEDDKAITAQASCWDLENNVAIRREVKRRIVDKRGVRYGDDMIATTSNAAASIALRNAIFAVVPKAIFKSVLNEVRKVAMGDERTLTATRVAIVDYFKKMGVTIQQICALLASNSGVQHKGIEDITLEDAAILKGIANSIKDGMVTARDAFSVQPEEVRAKLTIDKVGAPKAEGHTPPTTPPVAKKAAVAPPPMKVADLKELKGEVRKALGNLDPDLAGEVMFTSGVENIDTCMNVENLTTCMEKARKAFAPEPE